MSERETRDIEEIDDTLELDGDQIDFWEKKQRELVSSVVDYNLGALADLVSDQTIVLSPRYQRRFRWSAERQSMLVESFLMNVPIPPVFLNEDSYGKYSVIDGKQRLMAISDFMKGRLELRGLKVFHDINGLTFTQLPQRLQSVLKTRPTLRAVIILRQSDEDVKYEVFRRLNTGGVTLNAQEIRNSVYPGPLNDLILKLSEHQRFHQLLGIRNKERSVIHQQMRDAEFVLRYFTFRNCWSEVSGNMLRMLDQYMTDHQRPHPSEIVALREDFLAAIDRVSKCFGDYAFRRWEPGKSRWRKQVLASLYDAQMLACSDSAVTELLGSIDLNSVTRRVIPKFKRLFTQNDFKASIAAATNNASNFRTRVERVRDLLLTNLES